MDTLQKQFHSKIKEELQEKLKIKNTMAVPRLEKIVINMGVKDAVSDKKLVDKFSKILAEIAGQKPKVARSKKSIATFKVREGDPIGLVVTLRGDKMYHFFQKLTKIVMPRFRDFHGVKRSSFDPFGNYTLGLSEYSVFPEIDLSTVDRMQGLEIVVVTSAKDKETGFILLEALGMPFQKEG